MGLGVVLCDVSVYFRQVLEGGWVCIDGYAIYGITI